MNTSVAVCVYIRTNKYRMDNTIPLRILQVFGKVAKVELINASVTSNHGPRTIFITRTISCP